MANLIGTMVLWLVALAMIAWFPFTEFARGMATAPGKASRGGCLVSLFGLVLLGFLAVEAWGAGK